MATVYVLTGTHKIKVFLKIGAYLKKTYPYVIEKEFL